MTERLTAVTKLLEVRDRMTLVSVLAIRPCSGDEAERYLWGHAGYWEPEAYTIVVKLEGELEAHDDQFDWGPYNGRTLGQAHRYIHEHWDELASGDVVDVEYVLGEVAAPKQQQQQRLTVR